MRTPRFDGTAVIITGAGSGIGYQTALQAAAAGCRVLAASQIAAQVRDVTERVTSSGGTCVGLEVDITHADAPQRIVEAALSHFGRIDVVINNAGAAIAGHLLEQSEEQIDGQWQLHVAAPLRITRAALTHLRESGGQVMFLGSGLARVPSPNYGAYCAAKAAVRAMSTQLRRELNGSGVTVTYVDPGSVRTDFAKKAGINITGAQHTVEPEHVARRIVQAIRTRPKILNAVPFHTMVATLGEWFPGATDRAIGRNDG
jgi:short-subunit dehydrogenase